MSVHVQGAEEAQERILRIVDALRPGGPIDGAAETGAQEAATYASDVAPRLTGALGRAIGVIRIGRLFGVGIDPSATAPGGGKPEQYGPVVADSVLDFFQHTGEQHGRRIVDRIFGELVQVAE